MAKNILGGGKKKSKFLFGIVGIRFRRNLYPKQLASQEQDLSSAIALACASSANVFYLFEMSELI